MSDSDDLNISPEEVEGTTKLYLLIGACIAQFSIVEESLAALFGVAAGIPRMETAFRINDEIREFQYRLGATGSAVQTWAEQLENKNDQTAILDRWNTLRTTIKEDSQVRNRLAHSKIVPNDNDDGTTTPFVCPYFQFYSHMSEIRAQKGDKFKIPDGVRKYDAQSMTAKLARFEKTSGQIDQFINLLFAHGATPPK